MVIATEHSHRHRHGHCLAIVTDMVIVLVIVTDIAFTLSITCSTAPQKNNPPGWGVSVHETKISKIKPSL